MKVWKDLRVVVQPAVGWIGIGTARDHMNPRSSNAPSEGDSRRQLPAVNASLGGIVARVGFVAVTVPALRC